MGVVGIRFTVETDVHIRKEEWCEKEES